MEKHKISVSNEAEDSNKSAQAGKEADESHVLKQELETSDENRVPYPKFKPKLNCIFEEERDSDEYLEEDAAKSSHETSEKSSEYAKESIEQKITETEKFNKESNTIYQSNLKDLDDSKSRGGIIKGDAVSKLETRLETSTRSKDETLSSASGSQFDSLRRTESSKVRSAKEVPENFRLFMRSNVTSLESIETDHVSKKGIKPSPETGIRILEDPMTTARTISKYISKAVTETAMNRNSEQELPRAYNSTTTIRNARKTCRQRIVYDERVEHMRGWIIQQIKDMGISLKFKIMEGKYSEDMETKMICIEEAKNLQEEIDGLFDCLDDCEKLENIPKWFKSYSNFSQKDASESPKKSKKEAKISEGRIKSFSSLFSRIYKPPTSESKNENVFRNINTRSFISAFDAYLASMRVHNNESKRSKDIAKSAVNSLNRLLDESRLKMKCKTSYIDNKSLDDYRTCIRDLKIASDENSICLTQLHNQAASLILPLMTYLSESRRKIVKVFEFLNEERSDVFPKIPDKNKEFFEKFCSIYFKS